MNGSFSVKTWLVVAVPLAAFLVGVVGNILAVAVWKGEISTRLTAVEVRAENNKEVTEINEQTHRDEMWRNILYLHSLDQNILVIATKMKIPKSELSSLDLEVPKRAKLSN